MSKPSVCCCLCIIMLLWLTGSNVLARPKNYTDLTTENGLPSDNVYFLMKDTYGYLWMATEKGVVKYNGYTMKKFGLPEGLSTDDVWYLYEDSRHRIWLSTLSNEMGYLYKDVYHAPHIQPVHNFLRPHHLADYGNSIAFYSEIAAYREFYIENNDSFYRYINTYKERNLLLCKGNSVLRACDNGISIWRPNMLQFRKLLDYDLRPLLNSDARVHVFSDFLVTNKIGGNTVACYNLSRPEIKQLALSARADERIYTSYMRDSIIWFVTNHHVFCFNRQLQLQRMYDADSLWPGASASGEWCVNMLEDRFWKQCFSTRFHGVCLQNVSHAFRQLPVENGATLFYAGATNDTTHFWYNSISGSIVRVNDRMEHTALLTLKNDGLVNVTAVNKDTSFLAARKQLYWLIGSNYVPVSYNSNIIYEEHAQQKPPKISTRMPEPSYGVIPLREKLFFTCSTTGFGYMVRTGNFIRSYQLWNRKLNVFTYDPKRKAFWVSSNNEILVYQPGGRQLVIDRNILRHAGIQKIEQILIDTATGNASVKDYRHLFYYNARQNRVVPVLTHYNMEGAIVKQDHDRLIAAGRFGLVISGVKEPDSVQMYYPNIRNAVYNNVYEMQVSQRHIILKTDKGFFIVSADTDRPAIHADIAYRDIKLLANYDDSLHSIHNGDTLQLHQRDLSMQFDMINPNGTGTPYYRYMIRENNNGWTTLGNNGIYFRDLEPGRYYTLAVTVGDDIMTGNLWEIKLYVLPQWWQTAFGSAALLVISLLALSALTGFVIMLTNRAARRRHVRHNLELELKNLRLETELKSVYAQINPHFIFNTLSTTSYFIKKNNTKEANRHIVAFSKLLRSYIHSSRNKFISLETEIDNINNYILLQQSRFEDRFSYRLHVDERIDTAQFKIPALLLQPLVENAINHGLLHKNGHGQLTVSFTTNDNADELYCVIDDDGIGRDASRRYKEENGIKTTSYGSDLIADLIAVLNTYDELKVSIGYTDKTPPETGTAATITIKYNR